jgi:hypothetical protein
VVLRERTANATSAFNAIVSSSVVMLDISYGIPIAINCLRGRKMLPERPFVLPNAVGWTVNLVRKTNHPLEALALTVGTRLPWPISPSPPSCSSFLLRSL